MIEIKIADPHLMQKEVLRKTAAYLLSLIGDELVAEDKVLTAPLSQPLTTIENIPQPSPVGIFMPDPDEFDALPSIIEESVEFVAPPVPVVTSEHLDSAGLPWDAEIHSRTKSKTADGRWRVKRGSIDSTPPIPRVPLPPPLPIFPKAPVLLEEDEFPLLMDRISKGVISGIITNVLVNEIVRACGAESIISLSQRPELIPSVSQELAKRGV